ncbi:MULTISPECIES: hypothetical protein [unclassified Pseudactinotalea]|uniref:hypothetical protein n=1 Tax=Micrococcales TaxID=85006 RepID=UPI003C7DA8E2
MKRLFWIGVGVAASVVVLRKVQQVNSQIGEVAHAVSPAGIADSVSSMARNLKEAVTTLRESMAENEAALSAALLPSEAEQERARAHRRSARAEEPRGWDDDEDAFF